MYSHITAMSKPGVPVEWTVQRSPNGRAGHDRWEVSASNGGYETVLYAVLSDAELHGLAAEIAASLNEEMTDTLLGEES